MLSSEDRAFVLDIAKMHFDDSLLDETPDEAFQVKTDCVTAARRVLLAEVQAIGAQQFPQTRPAEPNETATHR